ncbi:MAG: hypothetical protein CMP08_11265 [Xanthomonadales bacterium]|nr:hypothetical protein [Xanthomonadales bacterium]
MSPIVTTEAGFLEQLKRFEGFARHMYLDTRANVTIGTGLLLASADAAVAADLGFTERQTGAPATDAAVRNDYDAVAGAPPARYPPSQYLPYTDLVASLAALNDELAARVDTARNDARAYDARFDDYPASVRYGLLDLAFNLGRPGLLEYRRLRAALHEGDWASAAEQSYRYGVQDTRNQAIARWIRAATG